MSSTRSGPCFLPVAENAAAHAVAVRDLLRAATRERHIRLDGSLPIARAGANHQDYVAHLQALHGWLAPLNRALWQLDWPAALEAPLRGAKLALLEHDLRYAAQLGLSAATAFDRSACAALPQLTCLNAYAIGVAYVIEGSQVGGAMLARRFSVAPAQHGFTYLVGYGAATGSMWQGFLRFMGAAIDTPEQSAQAVQGACDAFDTLLAWMGRERLLDALA